MDLGEEGVVDLILVMNTVETLPVSSSALRVPQLTHEAIDRFTIDIGEPPKFARKYVSLKNLGRGVLRHSGSIGKC